LARYDHGDGQPGWSVGVEELLRLTGETVAGISPSVEVVDERQGCSAVVVEGDSIAVGILELQRFYLVALRQSKWGLGGADRLNVGS